MRSGIEIRFGKLSQFLKKITRLNDGLSSRIQIGARKVTFCRFILLGNQALYTILHQGHYELRIDLEDWENNTAFARFEYFKIGDPIEFYKLTVAEYSGSAGIL